MARETDRGPVNTNGNARIQRAVARHCPHGNRHYSKLVEAARRQARRKASCSSRENKKQWGADAEPHGRGLTAHSSTTCCTLKPTCESLFELSRDHRAIDYGPVQFEHGGTSLWLPWYAELRVELRGKRYHHRHTLTDYKLFSVHTRLTLSPPPKTIR